MPSAVREKLSGRNWGEMVLLDRIGHRFEVGSLEDRLLSPIGDYPKGFKPQECDADACGALVERAAWWECPPGSRCQGWCFQSGWGFGWVSLRELEEVNWQERLHFAGWLPEQQYDCWNHETYPESYRRVCYEDADDVDEPSAIGLVSEEEFLSLRREGRPPTGNFYIRVRWEETRASCVGGFYTTLLPWMRTLGPPDRVRLIFGFYQHWWD
jgi:hypothetical protein